MPTLHENVTLVAVDDPMILVEAAQRPMFQKALVGFLDDRHAVINPDRLDAVIKILTQMGHNPRIG